MEAIKYRYSGGHKTVLDIGDNDTIVRIAINCAIEDYIKDFKELCRIYYKQNNKNFVFEAAIKDHKKVIRDYRAIRDKLDNPIETVDQIGARTMAAKLF